MRAALVRWGMPAYVLLSLVALTWLLVANTSLRTFRNRAFATDTTLMGNTLLGAIQSLDALATAGAKGSEDVTRSLVPAEASLAQVEIVALDYQKVSGNATPLSKLAGMYALQIRLVREEFGRSGSISADERKTLADVRADLQVLRGACQADVLSHGSQAAITRLFTERAADLRVASVRSSLQPGS